MPDPIQNSAVRTEAEKGTNVGTYDAAVRTEAEKEAAVGGYVTYKNTLAGGLQTLSGGTQ